MRIPTRGSHWVLPAAVLTAVLSLFIVGCSTTSPSSTPPGPAAAVTSSPAQPSRPGPTTSKPSSTAVPGTALDGTDDSINQELNDLDNELNSVDSTVNDDGSGTTSTTR